MHGLLLLSSVRLNALCGEHMPTKALLHQGLTVHFINEAMQTKTGSSDAVLGAVVALVGYEVSKRESIKGIRHADGMPVQHGPAAAVESTYAGV